MRRLFSRLACLLFGHKPGMLQTTPGGVILSSQGNDHILINERFVEGGTFETRYCLRCYVLYCAWKWSPPEARTLPAARDRAHAGEMPN
jgi:hypothetical protein